EDRRFIDRFDGGAIEGGIVGLGCGTIRVDGGGVRVCRITAPVRRTRTIFGTGGARLSAAAEQGEHLIALVHWCTASALQLEDPTEYVAYLKRFVLVGVRGHELLEHLEFRAPGCQA